MSRLKQREKFPKYKHIHTYIKNAKCYLGIIFVLVEGYKSTAYVQRILTNLLMFF